MRENTRPGACAKVVKSLNAGTDSILKTNLNLDSYLTGSNTEAAPWDLMAAAASEGTWTNADWKAFDVTSGADVLFNDYKTVLPAYDRNKTADQNTYYVAFAIRWAFDGGYRGLGETADNPHTGRNGSRPWVPGMQADDEVGFCFELQG